MTRRSGRAGSKPQAEPPDPSRSSLHGSRCSTRPRPQPHRSLPPRSQEERGETQHWRHFTDGNTEARRPRGACLGPRQQSEFLLGPQSSAEALCCLLKAHLALEMDFLTSGRALPLPPTSSAPRHDRPLCWTGGSSTPGSALLSAPGQGLRERSGARPLPGPAPVRPGTRAIRPSRAEL